MKKRKKKIKNGCVQDVVIEILMIMRVVEAVKWGMEIVVI